MLYHFLTIFSYHKEVFNKKIDAIINEKFGPGITPVANLEERTLIAMVNTNPAMDYLAPLPENVIPVGGLHVRDTKPLPKVCDSSLNTEIRFNLHSSAHDHDFRNWKTLLILRKKGPCSFLLEPMSVQV